VSLSDLVTANPWPAVKPALDFDDQGWLADEHKVFVKPYLSPDAKVILELGSWLGKSTRLWLRLAPNATLICVDTWRGSTDMIGNVDAEPRLAAGLMYEQFLANQWDERHRVIPIKTDSQIGMEQVAAAGVVPDFIYFDTEHTTTHVRAELETALRLFPTSQFYGDDWGWPSVQKAVTEFAAERGYVAKGLGNAWVLTRAN